MEILSLKPINSNYNRPDIRYMACKYLARSCEIIISQRNHLSRTGIDCICAEIFIHKILFDLYEEKPVLKGKKI